MLAMNENENKLLSLQDYAGSIKHRAPCFMIFMNNIYYLVTTHFLKLFSRCFRSQTHFHTGLTHTFLHSLFALFMPLGVFFLVV